MWYRLVAPLALLVGCASAGRDRPGAHVDGGISLHDSAPAIDSPPFPDAPAGCVMQMRDLLANGNFDGSPLGTGWTQSDPSLVTPQDGVPEQSAPNKAWLGGVLGPLGGTVSDGMYQDVAVPATTTALTLTGFFDVRSGENPADPTVFDVGAAELVTPGGTVLEAIGSYDNTTTQTGWVPISHTFTSNVAGQTVRLRFTSTNDEVFATSFYFDTLALQASFCQ